MNQTNFLDDISRGKSGEQIFKTDFLEFLEIEYVDVTGCQKFQAIDTDFKAKVGEYEVKLSYKDDRMLCIEEYTNVNESLGKISYGWFYKSKADLLVFISKKTKVMVIVPFTDNFKSHYESIKDKYSLIRNKVSVKNNSRRQSAFRKVSLDDMRGYFSIYKRIE